MRRRAQTSESGDTLIEILIAIVIIALTVTALLSGLVTAITSSSTEQSLSTEDAIVNGFAQAAQYEIQQASVFTNCSSSAYRLISAPLPSSGPVGSKVTVFVTGLAASYSPLKVALVSATNVSTPATVVSGGSTDPNGDASVTFTVPNVSGPQTVTVKDSSATPVSSPTAFTAGGTAQGTTPTGYTVFVNPVQQYDSQVFAQGGNPWVAASSPTCPDSGAQLISVFARNGADGSLGSLSFVALGQAATTVLVTSAPTGPILGGTLTFTAKVVPPNSTTAAPVGSVQWAFAQSPGSPTCPNSTLSTISGSNTSSATCTVTGAQVGTYSVTASYPASGTNNNNYGPGSGAGTITVGKATSSTTVTEVSSPTPAQPGSKLTFTATVGANPAVNGDPKPSGAVVWQVTGPGGGSVTCQDTNGHNLTNNTYNMPSGGTGTNTAPCVIPSASVGTYTASATYGGDGNYGAAQPAQTAVNVGKATPTISFSTSPQSPQPGQTFTVTATVNEPNGGPNPTGTLTWTLTPPSGSATCANSTLNGNGSGTCTITNAVKGTYTVAASYGGDGTYNPANGSTQVAVNVAPAGFDIQATGTGDSKPDTNDTIVYTYNQAMSLSSIYSGWNGSSVNVVAEFTRTNGQTQLTIQCNGSHCNDPNLGTVNLGDASSTHYLNGGGRDGTTVDVSATMVASTNAAGQTVITITLTQSSSQFNTVSGNTTLTWTPDNGATNTSGTPVTTTTVTESGSPKKNF